MRQAFFQLVGGAVSRARPRAWSPLRVLQPALWLVLGLLLPIPAACFLLLAFSPATFAQGSAWFTFQNFSVALRGPALRGLLNSLAVGIAASLLALVCALGLAWLLHRTTLRARGFWTLLIWALLLIPSYLSAIGWQVLLQRDGVAALLGVDATPLRQLIFGPPGVVWVLAAKGVPFAYLAIAAALLGLGREFEDAARVHGAGRWAAIRLAAAILLPALWSAIAIVFAESISDFGVASTLAAQGRFPLATYTLYLAIDSMPIRFPVASAVSWFLVVGAGLALLAQYRALRGRSFAVLGGRARPSSPQSLGWGGQLAALAAVALFFAVSLGIPLVGALSASLLTNTAGGAAGDGVTLANYRRALGDGALLRPLLLSARLAAVTATLAVFGALLLGRLLADRRRGRAGQVLDLLLLGAVALPSIVLAAGYIFAYNLPILSRMGIHLYGTLPLLGMAYIAAALPPTTRLLVGPLAQIQASLLDAARVHGAGPVAALVGTVLPLLARSLLWAWLLTFSGTLLELPISQILYPPGREPLAIGIIKHLENYDYAGGTAMMVIAVLGLLAVIGLALGLFRLLAPRGWQGGGRR